MSDLAIAVDDRNSGAFAGRTMLFVVATGVAAFLGMLVLGAYAPDLRSGKDGGAHALSNAATGFSGLVRLAEATGRNPRIVRSEAQFDSEALLVLTPEDPAADLSKVLGRRASRVTLVVLPKWKTEPDALRPGWVRSSGLMSPRLPEGILTPRYELDVIRSKGHGQPLVAGPAYATANPGFAEPIVVQSLDGEDLTPLIVDQAGAIVLARVADRPLFVLADPDLLNNRGMGSAEQARAALALLDYLNSTGSTELLFDVTLNGLGHSRSPLKLAFDPPFLAVTLAILATLLIVGWQALVRFGAPLRPERAIAFGKAALVDNSAALVRKAGREAKLGRRYVDLVRDRAAILFRLPPDLKGWALDERLDAMNSTRSFNDLATAAGAAESRDEMLRAAQQLHQWVEETRA